MSDDKYKGKLKFDFSHISALHVDDLNKAQKSVDLRAVANVLAQYATSCPPEWGKPDDPMSYLKLDYRPDFLEVIQFAAAELAAPAKNSDAPSTST